MTMSVYHAVAVMQEINQRNKHYKYNTKNSVLYMSHCDNFSPINKSSLENSLSEKYVHIHIPGCQKMRPFTQKSRKLGSFIYFLLKKGEGWSGGAKVLCILHHRGVQLILAYSWARPAILVVGKGRGGMFLFLLFLHFHSCSSFFPVPPFHLLYSLFFLFSPFLWEMTQNDPQGLTCR